MLTTELSGVPQAALPIAAFRDHLRLGTGFADDALQDDLLADTLRAALAAVEGRTGKALIARDFSLVVQAWRDLAVQELSRAPVAAILSFAITDRQGADTIIDAARYVLREDAHRPALEATGLVLPAIPVGGAARITFTAGFGAWEDVPPDLRRAVLLLAAHYYEDRAAESAPIPGEIAALIAPHRPVRLFGGRGL